MNIKESILGTNFALSMVIFVLNIFIIITGLDIPFFGIDEPVLGLALGENIMILLMNLVSFLICKFGDK